ncbi:reductive dehalogenase [candidate division KSB1 bacterium]
MSRKEINRRNFLKNMGAGGAVLGAGLAAPKIISKTADGIFVESEREYGGFQVKKLTNDKVPYEVDPEVLEPMKYWKTVFGRGWDPIRREATRDLPNVGYENLVNAKGLNPNQTRLDYALMDAAWRFARYPGVYDWKDYSPESRKSMNQSLGPWDPADLDMTWEDASLAVKHAGLFFGASLAGIADLNPLWIYSEISQNQPVLFEGEYPRRTREAYYLPKSMNKVIALAFEEDYTAIQNSWGRLASAAVGDGYSRMAITSSTLVDFITELGYFAVAAGNELGLSIPMAIDAGFGELGRNGLLITPKYGPRVRLAKIITNMPLVPDSPISFGVKEFCEACMLCADDCPSKSIPTTKQTWKGTSFSNNPGSKKWYIYPETCNDFNGFSCSNCKRVCPFNKPNNSWLHKLMRQVIKGRSEALDGLMVTLDQASGYGGQVEAKDWWKLDGQKSITARESM